jgi:GT2 family glycosyltransferase
MSKEILGFEQSGLTSHLSVGAVVTNFNGGHGVLRCIASLTSGQALVDELIVVDSASSDDSPSLIAQHFPNVRILRLSENLGPCVTRNAGLRALSTDLAVVIDDDMYLVPDALGLMLNAYATSDAKLVCPRILLHSDDKIIQADGVAAHFLGTLTLRHGFTRRSSQNALCDAPLAVSVPGCPSACFLVDRKIVLQAGGFDEAYFFYFEDLEFNLRLRALGYTMVCVERAVAYHDRGVGTPGLSFRGNSAYPEKRYYLSARNRLTTILIHYRPGTIILLSPALLTYELLLFAFAIKKGFIGSWIRSWTWQATNWRMIRDRRARAQKSRKLADGEILTGGPIPVAPGVNGSRSVNRVLIILSACLDYYWRLVRPCLR